jgi:hypothetical protein
MRIVNSTGMPTPEDASSKNHSTALVVSLALSLCPGGAIISMATLPYNS